jgi:hypothetical protein
VAPSTTNAKPVGNRAASSEVVEAASGETILSVLPARAPAARVVPPTASGVAARTTQPGASTVAPRQAETSASAAMPSRVRSSNEAASSATAAQAPAAAALAGPRARCGDRNFLSMLICVKRECDNPALFSHPECVKMREQEEASQNSAR